jgi:hypothetical protein
MMRKHGAFFLVFLLVFASCNFFEPQSFDTGAEDTETPEIVELAAGPSVNVPSNATEATVRFAGAVGSAPATADFTVSPGGTLSTVSINTNTKTVFVIVTFAANPTGTDKTYTVGIAPNSTKIKGTASVVITQKADAEAVLKESRKELTAGDPVDVASDATEATVTFTGASGLTLTAADFTVGPGAEISLVRGGGDIVSVTVTFEANTTGTDKTYTVGIAGDSTKIKGSAQVITHGPAPLDVYSVDELADLIKDIKNRLREADRVIRLTKDFYTDANAAAAFIVVDAGDTDNAKPYTIRGLGTKPGTPALKTGILLANDNITLEDVTFAITDPTKAAITKPTNPSYTNIRYTAAISIGRYDGTTWLGEDDLASKNVTVQNCTISYAKFTSSGGYDFNAGIYVNGDLNAAAPEDIVLTGNVVTAAGTGNNAAQAVIIGHYDPSIVITGNSLMSSTGGLETINAPASALFLNINPAQIENIASPQITGNDLDGRNIDFYVNIYSTGDYQGVPDLFNSKFGTYYSTWVADVEAGTGSFYKELYKALIDQAQYTGYAGLFFMVLGGDAGSYDGYCFVYEAWEKSGGEVTAVDYWGATILNDGTADAYNAGSDAVTKYDTETATGEAAAPSSGYTTAAGYRGRIILTTNPKTYTFFHFNPEQTVEQGTYSSKAEASP